MAQYYDGTQAVNMFSKFGKKLDSDLTNFYPTNFKNTYTFISLWKAYYAGDLNSLSGNTQTQKNNWLYKKGNVTYPVAKKAASKVAKACISELPRFTLADEVAQGFIDKWVVKDDFMLKLREAAELMFALGGCNWTLNTTAADDEPVLKIINPTDSYPITFRNDKVYEVAVWYLIKEPLTANEINSGVDYYWIRESHIEHDGQWFIINQLFKGTQGEAGKLQAFNTIDETNEMHEIIQLNTENRWAGYFKSPEVNNIQPYSKLGMGMIANTLELIDMVNLTYQSWYKEHHQKQPKLFVSEDILSDTYDNDGNRTGVRYDGDQDIFVKMDLDVDAKKPNANDMIKAVEWDYKTGVISDSVDNQLVKVYDALGISGTNVKKSGSTGIKSTTATEMEIAEKDTFETKNDFQNVLKRTTEQILLSVLEIGNVHYGKKFNLEKSISVEFMDSIKHDQKEKLEKVELIKKTGLQVSEKTLLGMVFPDWDDARIEEEIKLYNDEAIAVAEIDFMGATGDFGKAKDKAKEDK